MFHLHWSQIVLLVISAILFAFGIASIPPVQTEKNASKIQAPTFMKQLSKLDPQDMASYLGIFLVCGLFVLVVLSFCSNIQPMERFENPTCDTLASMEEKITCAELQVRKLITRADAFTEGDLGDDGQKHPQLVADALGKARVAAGGPLIDCSPGHTGDFENRLSRLERTLQSFTEPIFKKAASTSNTCEGFQGTPKIVPTNEERIAAILALIQAQQTKYLKPIDDKVAALQRHDVSDCDKNKGGDAFHPQATTGQ